MRELPLTMRPAPLPVTPVAERSHRQHYLPGRLLQILADHAGISTLGMTPGEHAEAAVELERVIGMLTGLQLDHLAHLEHSDVPTAAGASTTAGWLRAEVPVGLRAARRKVRLAKRIDADTSRLGGEVTAGRVLPEQAEVIAAAVDALPVALVDPGVRAAAEAHLVEAAAVHGPEALRRLGDRILQHVAPQVADVVDAARIAALEREADRRKSLRWCNDGSGTVHGRFSIPDRHAAMLQAALAAFTNPARPDPIRRTADPTDDQNGDGGGEGVSDGTAPAPETETQTGRRWRSRPDVDGEAFCQLLESLDPATLPRTSGMNATVVAVIPVSTLIGDPAAPDPPATPDSPAQPYPPAGSGGCCYCATTRASNGGHRAESSNGDGAEGSTGDGADGAGGGRDGRRNGRPADDQPAGYRPTGQAPGHLLGTDIRLSPAQARRMACRAGVIPAVLDGAGRVLDLGRKSRLATPAQILALRLHHHGRCAVTGCDRPASTCEAHHWRQPWATGGRTDLADLCLLCPRHHTLAHTNGMTLQRQPDGQFRLHRRE